MKLEINIGRGHLISIIITVAIVSGVAFVIAQVPNPGHSGNQIEVTNAFCNQITGFNCGNLVTNAFCQLITGHNCGFDINTDTDTNTHGTFVCTDRNTGAYHTPRQTGDITCANNGEICVMAYSDVGANRGCKASDMWGWARCCKVV